MALYTSKYTGAEIDAALDSIALKAIASEVTAKLAALEARIKALEDLEEDPEITKYTVTVTSDNADQGTVTGGGEFDANSSILISANPKEGFVFEKWNDADTTNPRTVTVTENVTYTAKFKTATQEVEE